jgi:tRNA pseudouridine55 synthase
MAALSRLFMIIAREFFTFAGLSSMGQSFHGLLVLDKPGGITSRDAVDRAQSWFPRGARLGHTGTLDPLATGVLVLCVGVATRMTEYVQRMEKVYRSGLLLGARSDTDDADGTITPVADAEPPKRDAVETALQQFVGEIDQVPPHYSAAYLGGQRAYELARQGKEVALQSRRVEVYAMEVVDYAYPRLQIEVRCGKGTYIRSLARDLGERLGCGALVETLRRTRVGTFRVEDALPLTTDPARARQALLTMARAVSDLPALTLPIEEARRLRSGQTVLFRTDSPLAAGEAAVFGENGDLIGVIQVEPPNRLRPHKMLFTNEEG